MKNNKLEVKREPLDNLKARSIAFLDFTIWIDKKEKLQTHLYVNQSEMFITLFLSSNSHFKNIPYSLAYKIKRLLSGFNGQGL